MTNEPTIEYPCLWSYRIIGTDETDLRTAAQACLGKLAYALSPGNTSGGGKYISLNIDTTVVNQEERDQIFAALQNHPQIKMVL